MNRVHIIATVGPTMESDADLKKAVKSGVDCFRLHLGYKDRNHENDIVKIRDAFSYYGKKAYIMLDFPSLRPRISPVARAVNVKEHDIIELCNDTNYSSSAINVIPVDNLIVSNIVGNVIKFLDGRIEGIICAVNDKEKILSVKITKGSGILKPNNSIIITGDSSEYELISDYEISLLEKISNNKRIDSSVRFVFALSMIINTKQILAFQEKIKSILNFDFDIISKIERKAAVKNIISILQYSPIIIARGDLLLELEYTEFPYIQEYLIKKARQWNRKVLIATQLLEQYAEQGITNRSELIDLWSAYNQGVSGIVLCKETAYSHNPIEVIKFSRHFFEKQTRILTNNLEQCTVQGKLGEAWLTIMDNILCTRDYVEDYKELLNVRLDIAYSKSDKLLKAIINDNHWLADNITEMQKVFFDNEQQNKFQHHYASLMQSYKGGVTVSPLDDIIEQLTEHPTTRQALITLIPNGKRVPCINTIHFLNRNNELYVSYYSRGQDMFNKFIPDFMCIVRMAYRILKETEIRCLKNITANIYSAHIYKHELDEAKRLIATFGRI